MTSSNPLPPPPGSRVERNRTLAAARGEVATRRATMLLMMLGSLVLVPSVRCFLELTKDSQALIDEFLAATPPPFREQFKQHDLGVIARVQWIVFGMLLLFIAMSLLLSIKPVREGRCGVIIYAIAIVSLCSLVCAANALLGTIAVLLGAVQAIAAVVLACCVLTAFIVCLFSLISVYKAASFAKRETGISLQSVPYPPGYASGYASHARTTSSTMTTDGSSDSAPQTT